MKNQSGTIKTNPELYRVVMGGSGGNKTLPGGGAHFSLQTNTHTLHHNIYIIIIITHYPDYLRHAECIKERSTAADFCGPHYNRLVEQVLFDLYIIIILGKPSDKKSAVFFNIVQKAFGPPPPFCLNIMW